MEAKTESWQFKDVSFMLQQLGNVVGCPQTNMFWRSFIELPHKIKMLPKPIIVKVYYSWRLVHQYSMTTGLNMCMSWPLSVSFACLLQLCPNHNVRFSVLSLTENKTVAFHIYFLDCTFLGWNTLKYMSFVVNSVENVIFNFVDIWSACFHSFA